MLIYIVALCEYGMKGNILNDFLEILKQLFQNFMEILARSSRWIYRVHFFPTH